MTVDAWLEAAIADARARGRDELVPLLRGLADATRRLRDAPWNVDASGAPGLDRPRDAHPPPAP